jgi:hypothetical protein
MDRRRSIGLENLLATGCFKHGLSSQRRKLLAIEISVEHRRWAIYPLSSDCPKLCQLLADRRRILWGARECMGSSLESSMRYVYSLVHYLQRITNVQRKYNVGVFLTPQPSIFDNDTSASDQSVLQIRSRSCVGDS